MPFPKPDKLPRWATEFVKNGVNHTPNVQEPPDAKKDFGWDFLEKPPRQWVNWLAFKTYQWLLWSEESIEEIYTILFDGIVPPGAMLDFGGGVIPSGWLGCDGFAVSRAAYADLFAAIGTTWGAGDGVTTFNLPDFRGRNGIGAGQGAGLTNRALGAYGGEEAHTLDRAEIPPHTHGYLLSGIDAKSGANTQDWLGPPVGERTSDGSEDGLAGQPHNNMQPFAVVNKIIKC